ncbi:hypothetical protein [uncultured Tyzzerella sp.]|uniref:hypothetical protein n=1 Tax=uncultured Tyzzerella sp. TaxID=2321398 RepID=UPI0029423108|nr:hypothetical protein [uncultured Tyzzerella sp.]
MVNINKKNALSKLYIGRCKIYEYENFIDENSKAIKQNIRIKYDNLACRVSYYNNSSNILASKEDTFNNIITQKVKIFLDNTIKIKAGSIIEVNQNGKITKYKNSGEPVIYSNHQEIMLDIFDNIG